MEIYYTSDLRSVKPKFFKSPKFVSDVALVLDEESNKYTDELNKRDRETYSKLIETLAMRSDKPLSELEIDEYTYCRRSGKLRVRVLESGLSLLNRIGSNPNFLAIITAKS